MAKRKKVVEIVHLVCKDCSEHNYTIRRKRGETKLELSKFCPRERKHTKHLEKRK